MTRRWLFSIQDDEGSHYADAQGRGRDADVEFIGTDEEANQEAERRANLWQYRSGMWVLKTRCESRGKVEDGQEDR